MDDRKDERERDRLLAADVDVSGVENASAERTSCCAVAAKTIFAVACSANVEFDYFSFAKKLAYDSILFSWNSESQNQIDQKMTQN